MKYRIKLTKRINPIGLAKLLLIVISLAGCTSHSPSEPNISKNIEHHSGGIQWPTFNNRLNGQRFSLLDEITPDNASELRELCRFQIDGPTSFMAGLIVENNTIYTNTARVTVALDATSCAVKWEHHYTPVDTEITPSNRGPAVMNSRVFRGTGDGHLIALDANTGELLWKNQIASPDIAEFASAAPLAWQGIVFMGVGGGDIGIRGRIMAFDAQTGQELWRFNTIPMGKETGAETWQQPESARTGGGGVWGAMSLDVTTAELFIPVGNPWPDLAPEQRPGDNLFTNSIVVLDAISGKLKWWYQATPNDGHDLDLAAAPVLYRDKEIRDMLVFGGKDGHIVAIDRATHKPTFRTAVTRIENPTAPPTEEGTLVCPGFAGGIQWNGPTLDRTTNNIVSGVVDLCMSLVLGPVKYDPPNASYGGSPRVTDEAKGSVVSLDALTGNIKWRYSAEKPVIAGVTPTAGGVTFTGDLAGNFLVLNSATGKLEHSLDTKGAMAGGVVTYEVNNKQYVAVASGNVSKNAFGVLGVPTVIIMTRNPNEHTSTAININKPTTGRDLYTSICVSCHGANGDMMSDHTLSSLASRLDYQATVNYIKNPKLPMPKLFPNTLSQQDIESISTYIHQSLTQ